YCRGRCSPWRKCPTSHMSRIALRPCNIRRGKDPTTHPLHFSDRSFPREREEQPHSRPDTIRESQTPTRFVRCRQRIGDPPTWHRHSRESCVPPGPPKTFGLSDRSAISLSHEITFDPRRLNCAEIYQGLARNPKPSP